MDLGRPLLRSRNVSHLGAHVTLRWVHRDPEASRHLRPDSSCSVQARSILRAILRECTYLPDPQARDYIAKHAIARFKTYNFKAWKHRTDPQLENLLKDRQDEAQRALKQLQRANDGDRKCLRKALLMAYGRIGRRRHELMVPLMMQREGQPPHSLSPQLYALLQSQMRNSPPDITRPNPKLLAPKIPELNSYMRPMPKCRVANMTKKWFTDVVRRALPPLPPTEWNSLRDLATGAQKSRSSRTRKLTRGSKAGDRPSALEVVVAHGKGIVPKSVSGNQYPRRFDTRSMQRLWAEVFSQCPLMQWDSNKNRWIVTWGQVALHLNRQDSGARERVAGSFFESSSSQNQEASIS